MFGKLKAKFTRLSDWIAADPVRAAFVFLAASVIAIVFLLLAMCSQAHAGEATVSWTNPTQNTDDTAIPATGPGSLTGTNINYGICTSNNQGLLTTPAPATVTAPAPDAQLLITSLGAGRWCFRAQAVSTDATSAWTTYVNKTIAPAIPKIPGNLSAAGGIAFMATRQSDYYVMVPVGTVPASTACDTSNAVIAKGETYYAVPRAEVTWYGSTKPTVVMATCS